MFNLEFYLKEKNPREIINKAFLLLRIARRWFERRGANNSKRPESVSAAGEGATQSVLTEKGEMVLPTHPPLSFDTEIVFFLECGRRREGRRERKKIRFRSLRITLLCWLCAAGRRRWKEWRKTVHRHQRGAQQSLRNTPIRPRK